MNFFHFNRKMWGPRFYEVQDSHKRELIYKDFLTYHKQGVDFKQWLALQKTRG